METAGGDSTQPTLLIMTGMGAALWWPGAGPAALDIQIPLCLTGGLWLPYGIYMRFSIPRLDLHADAVGDGFMMMYYHTRPNTGRAVQEYL